MIHPTVRVRSGFPVVETAPQPYSRSCVGSAQLRAVVVAGEKTNISGSWQKKKTMFLLCCYTHAWNPEKESALLARETLTGA